MNTREWIARFLFAPREIKPSWIDANMDAIRYVERNGDLQEETCRKAEMCCKLLNELGIHPVFFINEEFLLGFRVSNGSTTKDFTLGNDAYFTVGSYWDGKTFVQGFHESRLEEEIRKLSEGYKGE